MHFQHVVEQQLEAYQPFKGSTEHLHGIIMVLLDTSGEEGKQHRQPTARHSADSPVSIGPTTTNGPTASWKTCLCVLQEQEGRAHDKQSNQLWQPRPHRLSQLMGLLEIVGWRDGKIISLKC